MDKSNQNTEFYSIILFLIWPFLALASAFRNYRSGWAKNILWAFIAFYGFAFAIGTGNQNADIVRYVEEYQNLHGVEMTLASAKKYFAESGEIDITKTFISVVLSRFTDSQSILTLVYGIIFGFFFSRNMWFVLDRLKGRLQSVTILLFTVFFLIVPIWDMNGFRMWTAAHVFIYGLLPFLFEGKKWGAVVATLSILVHFSFMVPVAVLFAYKLMGNRIIAYFIFFLGTFFISEINLEVFNNYVQSYAPEILQERTAGYRGEKYVEMYRENTNENIVWYAAWYGNALKWTVISFLIIFFFKGRKFFSEHKAWLNLFCFALLLYGAANLLNSLPSGGRFLDIGNLCALALITLYVQNQEQNVFIERFTWVATPALFLYIIVSVRIGLYSMSTTAILGNPVIALLMMGQHIPLNDFIKLIL